MIETNLKQIKEKSKTLMTNYHFCYIWPTDLLFSDFDFMCKATYSLVWIFFQINTFE